MATPLNTLQELLKTNGYSTTAARVAVFKALLQNGEALSMHELVEQATGVDRASVLVWAGSIRLS
jgi:Fe2+ or Zn2+ uptake regulation protein